ncbi:MAG: leucine-rich repeat domain-containing protein [Oscillospiraceae bacterium]|nr:leucine-rich repeat domain-containing protein [Oscillospiraceae bacterium]
MRNRIKILLSVMAAVFVVCSLTIMVSADKVLVASGEETQYSWKYYSNKVMEIQPKNWGFNLYSESASQYLTDSSTIVAVDLTGLYDGYTYNYLNINGMYCATNTIFITGDYSRHINSVTLSYFDGGLITVSFVANSRVNYMELYDCDVNSLNFLKGVSFSTLHVTGSSSLKNADPVFDVSYLSFQNCENLTNISMPDTLIGLSVYNSPKLTELDISDTLESCSLREVGITEITVPPTCTFNISSDTLTKANIIPGRKSIDSWMFEDCNNLSSVNIPSGVTTIQYSSFAFCYSLKSVELPDTVDSIYSRAFMGSGIQSINIPSGVTSIAYSTFRSCANLSYAALPASIESIDGSAFAYCNKLTNVYFEGSRTQWNNIEIVPTATIRTIDEVFPNATITFGNFITSEPKSFVGPIGGTAKFSVEADGEGLTYQWQVAKGLSWSNITNNGNSSEYSVGINSSSEGKRYSCIVTDVTGKSCTSEAATLHIGETLEITSQPVDFYGPAKTKAVLSVGAKGEDLTYQWQYFSKAWMNMISDGCRNDTIFLDITNARDGLMYRCIVTDKFGQTIISDPAAIYIATPLEITTDPVDFTGLSGKKATFTVEATGDDLKYQWQYKNATGVWRNSNSAGFDTPQMSVKITSARDGQQYRCIVTDRYQNTKTSAAATIHLASKLLEITGEPSDFIGKIGTYATFTVTADGDDIKYQWQYQNATGVWRNSNATGYNTASTKIKITEAREGQKYRCVVTDKFGNELISEEAAIVVEKEPAIKITSQPANYSGVVGSKAVFTVAATGDVLTYQWQYKAPSDSKWHNSTKDGYNTSSMSVKVTEARDGQMYRCVITDVDGNKVTSDEVSITVQKSQPTINAQPEDYTGAIGTKAVFTVYASGEGLTYQWQYKSPSSSKWVDSTKDGYDTASMTIKVTEAREGQMYRCVVTDCNGYTVTSDAATISIG